MRLAQSSCEQIQGLSSLPSAETQGAQLSEAMEVDAQLS